MIVTADPHGDFNATSQILRYSALAREVTVPRIPSVTSQILSSSNPQRPTSSNSGRTSPSPEALEFAIAEIARLSLENDNLSIRLAEEEIKLTETTIALNAAEEKILTIEAEVREECWAEMETRIEEEQSRYRTAWEQEKAMGEEFLDGKIGILERGGIAVAEDSTATGPSDPYSTELEHENENLRARIAILEREIQGRSPTKKSKTSSSQQPLRNRDNGSSSSTILFHDLNLSQSSPTKKLPSSKKSTTTLETSENTTNLDLAALQDLRLNDIHNAVTMATSAAEAPPPPSPMTKTPTTATAKKQRKLTTRKWDFADENELV